MITKENKMKLKNKVSIFLAAVILTFVGMNLIASPFTGVLNVGKEAGYDFISNHQAKIDTETYQSSVTPSI